MSSRLAPAHLLLTEALDELRAAGAPTTTARQGNAKPKPRRHLRV